MRHLTRALAAVALVACGDATAPIAKNVTGTWAYSVLDLAEPNGSVTCSITGLALGLTQVDTSLTGITSDWTFACTSPTGATTNANPSLPIRNGSRHGDSVRFDILDEDQHSAGVVVGDSMSGITTITVRLSSGRRVLTGHFSATRTK